MTLRVPRVGQGGWGRAGGAGMKNADQQMLRMLPSVESMLRDPRVGRGVAAAPRGAVAACVRAAIDGARARILSGDANGMDERALHEAIIADAVERVRAAAGRHYRKAINATGIILHTALGRAVLPARALAQIREELAGYSVLQMDLETGARSRRDERIEWLLRQLAGAEAATVVNNNAAATMIVLNTVGKDREIIVSRGQLVEIGGSFRLPEVMEASGARLVEVGTTNKTHARDYERAITEQTAAILRVHPSNYKITGFTSEVPLAELVGIAHSHNLVLIDDVGAGALIDFRPFGFGDQPTLPESVRAGADLITASADKLIGASQGGIILGRGDLIGRVRGNPLARALRVDKLTLAAMEATLSLFLDEALARREVPTLAILQRPLADLNAEAERIAEGVRRAGGGAEVHVADDFSQMGSGSLPGENLPTRVVVVRPTGMRVDELARRLRRHEPPIVARIQHDAVRIDPRTLLGGDGEIVCAALVGILGDRKP
jgi:L-seryl-tRNA(Ser) seleniumtransferase